MESDITIIFGEHVYKHLLTNKKKYINEKQINKKTNFKT